MTILLYLKQSCHEKATNKTTPESYGGEWYEYVPLGKHIVAAPGVCGGQPTFKYTRLEVSVILGKMLRVRHNHIDYCEAGSNKIFTLFWPACCSLTPLPNALSPAAKFTLSKKYFCLNWRANHRDHPRGLPQLELDKLG